ncbi:aldehyde dehydrogenase family protein [Lentzea sp. CA-135723]|uniref:aldehyde dehydrogenase family protein n=1 Tax=Lentzea sp. CA-135723 TaxID=3239950 RepID=UPI003D916F55
MQRLDRQYVNGKIVPSHGTDTYVVSSAITGEQIAEGVLGDAQDANDAVAAAKAALPVWSALPLEQRRAYLDRLADAFLGRRDEMVANLVEEFGTSLMAATFIVNQSADWFRDARDLVTEETFTHKLGPATVHKVPAGVAVLITPWNGASWFIAMKASLALAAGCTVVIKPSERGMFQAQPVLDAIADADLPPGVINVVFGKGDPVGNTLTAHPDVAKISLTGSTATGKVIARNAVDTMKRVTLELGGKSPMIILDDADTAHAVGFAIGVGMFNNSQACIAGTRILIPRSREDEFKTALAAAVQSLPIGDPRDEGTVIGPVLDHDQYERVQSYILTGIEEGGVVLAGGLGHPDGFERGNYVRPTLIATTNDKRIAQEEIFGPVLAVITYDNDDDAVTIANDSTYGLHAYVATADPARGAALARRLQVGRVMVNNMVDSREVPFGGFKQSGLGREFGAYGLEAYLETQAIFAA